MGFVGGIIGSWRLLTASLNKPRTKKNRQRTRDNIKETKRYHCSKSDTNCILSFCFVFSNAPEGNSSFHNSSYISFICFWYEILLLCLRERSLFYALLSVAARTAFVTPGNSGSQKTPQRLLLYVGDGGCCGCCKTENGKQSKSGASFHQALIALSFILLNSVLPARSVAKMFQMIHIWLRSVLTNLTALVNWSNRLLTAAAHAI